ncbi:MAG: flagellar biosynthesis protein FlhF [Syntrophomonas sp.]
MIIKKFVAKDFQSALKQAKAEMGRDAIILHTSKIKKGGILSFLFAPQVEITVAVDDNLRVNSDRQRKPVPTPAPAPAAAPQPVKPSPVEPEVAAVKTEQEKELLQEMQKMKSIISDVKLKMYEVEMIKGMSEEVQLFYETLVNNQVDKDIALKIINSVEARMPREKVGDDAWIRELCLQTLQEYIDDVKPINTQENKKGNLVFMIGPTGVGKTTTIAKLAANMAFTDGKDVALITLDTYRVSAAQQLRTFAEIIDIPISVVFNPLDLASAIELYKDKDIIFVDTAGRSPYKEEHMQELQEYIEIAKPDETILVLSITTHSSDLVNIYQKFNNIGVDKIIFTKLDETCNYGRILNTIYEIKKPIAYLTNGQNVPDDIEIPDSLRLAQMLLREGDAS